MQTPKPSLTFSVHPSSGVPIYRQLMDQVQALVAGGKFAAGDTLPSVQIYLVSSANIPVVDETGKQMQWLQSRLPGIAIHRGEYSPGRMMSGMLLSVLCGFFPFIAWFQSGLTLSQPLAAVMPGHRRPHLFWPVAVSLLTAVCFVLTAERIGVTWSAAITIGCACSMFAATILAGRDIRPTTLDGFLSFTLA